MELGPGLLGQVFDGVQRPLAALATEANKAEDHKRFELAQARNSADASVHQIRKALAERKPDLDAGFDHLLFSYHGIPVRHLGKADSSRAHCQVVADCCTTCSPAHATCYKAQCLATTRAFAARAGLATDRHFVSFQSRPRPSHPPFSNV